MVKMINKLTGTGMLVAEDRLEEYLAEGHSPAEEDLPKKSDHEEESSKENAPRKNPARK